jgi:hypothetical protein
MRLLLDENLDWRLQRDLPLHQVESVPPLLVLLSQIKAGTVTFLPSPQVSNS